LQIYDRKGQQMANIQLQRYTIIINLIPSDFQCFQWSWNGTSLAILLKSGELLLFNTSSFDISKVETGMKGLESISWSLDNEIVTIFNVIYNMP
jgi:hypothetical protein